MTAQQPLPFDPIARAADLWEKRVGPSSVMAAVTSIMRVQQLLQSEVDGALRPERTLIDPDHGVDDVLTGGQDRQVVEERAWHDLPLDR